ncbi:hypothetical protein QUF70_15200 [Desulfobacterales bacterium HSG17]|nr:hypothetical protein [Desulfobacterales bacterium HSG17]
MRNWVWIVVAVFSVVIISSGKAVADVFPEVRVVVIIDALKPNGYKWDKFNPWGTPPDIYGHIEFPATDYEVQLHRNTVSLQLVIPSIEINAGETIRIALFDNDRGRLDDTLAEGEISFTGAMRIEEKIGSARITIDFIQHLNTQ